MERERTKVLTEKEVLKWLAIMRLKKISKVRLALDLCLSRATISSAFNNNRATDTIKNKINNYLN